MRLVTLDADAESAVGAFAVVLLVLPLTMSATCGEHFWQEKNVMFAYFFYSCRRVWFLFLWMHFGLRHSLRKCGIALRSIFLAGVIMEDCAGPRCCCYY